MPRPRKTARLYLRSRKGRPPAWVIRDGSTEVSTGCVEGDIRGAEEALSRYASTKYQAPGALPPAELYIDEVMNAYLIEHVQHSPSREFLTHTAAPVLQWWSGKTLADINGKNCRAYVKWRTRQTHRRSKAKKPISEQTARHDLKTLRTAINWYHAEYGPLPSVPKVSLPGRKPQRQDYWLTRDEVAARIRAARRTKRTHHVARQILIGVYTGTRPGAILGLKWQPAITGGWFDLSAASPRHKRTTLAQASTASAHSPQAHGALDEVAQC